jgi:competence protein ComEC
MKKLVSIVIFSIIILGILVAYDYSRFNDGKLHIVFCNVGQGDAIFIRTPNGKNMLYDGGPDKSVLTCLSEHMPFWERQLDIIFLSHPHDDHFSGIYYLVDRYIALSFDTVDLNNKTTGFQILMEKIQKKHIPMKHIFAGDTYQVGDIKIHVLSPTNAYLRRTSPNGMIGESKEFASAVLQLEYGTFDLLLTGDSQVVGLEDAAKQLTESIDILHVPHHGSRFGLDKNILEVLNPKMAVISVGKNNYGHPSKQTIDMLRNKDIKILRTDKEGDIEIVNDGEKWEVRSNKNSIEY